MNVKGGGRGWFDCAGCGGAFGVVFGRDILAGEEGDSVSKLIGSGVWRMKPLSQPLICRILGHSALRFAKFEVLMQFSLFVHDRV